jgi:hypothetical protein
VARQVFALGDARFAITDLLTFTEEDAVPVAEATAAVLAATGGDLPALYQAPAQLAGLVAVHG